jgi:hypothetical protein
MKKAMILGLLLFGMMTQANSTDPVDEKKQKQYEYLKKAKYFEIRARLTAGEITLEEAQKIWQKNLRKLRKKEGK